MSSVQAAQGKVVVIPMVGQLIKCIMRDAPLLPQVSILVAGKTDSEPVLFVVQLSDFLRFALAAEERSTDRANVFFQV